MTIIAVERPLNQAKGATAAPSKLTNKRGTPDGLAGLRENWSTDIVSGFVVFLIALPLSLGIAMASGVPPMAGIISAIVGGLVVSMISGSHVTINGPAAGLIVVVLCSVERLGGGVLGYRATLAAVVVSGAVLVLLGLLRAGQLGKIFPASVVHGMLAAIGIIIMVKQLPFMLGTTALAREPLTMLLSTPAMLGHLNPALAAIGLVSLLILVLHGLNTDARIKRIPAPVIVIIAAMAMGVSFGLQERHSYSLLGTLHQIDPLKCLVVLPKNVLDGLVLPDFSLIGSYAFWLSVLSITLIQGLESLLSCTAVDRLDQLGRRAHLSRDIAAVGLGSMVAGTLGGLPIIAEIVRSTANVAAGARTRWSNFFHGLFALLALIFAAGLINRIPLAALAAILIVTGYKLAAPRIFKEVHAIGLEQTIIFVTTIVATLSTDLLIGVTVGIATKLALHLLRGADLRNLLSARVETINYADDSIDLVATGALMFSNYLSLKTKLDLLPQGKTVWFDLSAAGLIDHSVMEHLHHFAEDYARRGGEFHLVGLEAHQSASRHPLAARKLVLDKNRILHRA